MKLPFIIKRYSKSLLFFILLFLFLPAVRPLFHRGFFVSDDGEWMVIRFSAFYRALTDGQLPVRWLQRLNYGYGYPVANFLYPGFMYLGAPLRFLGLGFVDIIKIILGFSLVFSGIFTYFWLKGKFGRFSAAIGALFYVYAPYHLYDLYKRGSVGEMLALAVVPFLFWAIDRRKFLLAGFAYAALIVSHNTLALLFTGVIIFYLIIFQFISKPKLYTLYSILYTLLLGLGLSAFFWLPALFDLRYTVFSQSPVIGWREAVLIPNYFQLVGLPVILVFIFSSFSIKRMKIRSFFFWILFLLSFLLTLPRINILWKILPLTSVVQFSFRFLSLLILAAAYLSAFIVFQFSKKIRIIVGIILAAFVLFFSFPFMKPKAFFDKGEGFYTTNEATTTVKDEYMPLWVKEKPLERARQKVEIISGKGKITELFFNSRKTIFNMDSKTKSEIQINTIYFPGWKARVDNSQVQILYGNQKGLIRFEVGRGKHLVAVVFKETPLRLSADIISLVSLGVAVGLLIKNRKNEIQKI